MSFSLALVIMSFLTPILAIGTFILGYNVNSRHVKKIGLKGQKKKSDIDIIFSNIDRYDGTSKGQEEVK